MTVEPLPPPTWPHLMTSWTDSAGRRHRRCTCGRSTPAPGMATTAGADCLVRPCLDFGRVHALLLQAGQLIRSTGPAARSSWLPPACLTPAARRARGLAYVALIAAAAGQYEAPGPAAAAVVTDEQDTTPAEAEPRAVPRAEPDPTPDHRCIVWARPPACPHCKRAHARRGLDRPPLCADPEWTPVPVCRVCGYTLDPVAAAEFAGRHPECALPVVEREHYRAAVRELADNRRRAARPREVA